MGHRLAYQPLLSRRNNRYCTRDLKGIFYAIFRCNCFGRRRHGVHPLMAQTAHFVLTGAEQADFFLALHPDAADIDPWGFQQLGTYDEMLFGATVNGSLNDTPQEILLHFYTAAGGGGLDVIGTFGDGFFRVSPAGPSVFSGTVDAPTFVVGEYDFDSDFEFPTNRSYHPSITSDLGTVPEPATWAMMIVGFGLSGVQGGDKAGHWSAGILLSAAE